MFCKYILLYITTINCLKYAVSQTLDDIQNNFNTSSDRIKRKVCSNIARKWGLQIPYFVDENVDPLLIRNSLQKISLETCLTFRETKYMYPGMSGIRYFYGIGCNSLIGKADGKQWQPISIGENCDDQGRVQHETLHALGIDHEHNRVDRHYFLYILEKNILDDSKKHFYVVTKDNCKHFNIPYDYGSLMHYDMYTFSRNGYITMLPKDELYKKTIGQMRQLSFNDIKTVNLYYCSNRCPRPIKCFNGGYQNPNICNTCKCVEGFTGKNCKLLSKSSPSCGKTSFYAKSLSQEIKGEGRNYCIYHIKSRNRRKIGINIIFASFQPYMTQICKEKNTLEIKYWNDKTVTGARFCSLTPNTIFMSRSDHVIIYYRSTKNVNKFKLRFKKM